MKKRYFALVLALLLLFGLCPASLAAGPLTAAEAKTPVEKALANLQTQSGFRPGDSNSNCFTFAMSVTNKLFGIKLSDIEYHGEKERTGNDKQGYLIRIGRCFKSHAGYKCTYSSSGATELNAANVKKLLSQAKCGDIIQTTRNTGKNDSYANSKCETRHPHTMVVQSVGSNSLVVYEGNMNGQKVNIRSITYESFASTYNHTITLFRAENYDKVNGGSSSQTSASQPSTAPASTLTIAPTTSPGANLPQGKPFYFKGKLTSNYPITTATISILSPDAKTKYQTKTINPNTTTVDIATSGLDALKFGQLAPGSYIFHLTAKDSSGCTKWWQANFSIAGAAPTVAAPTIVISGVGETQINVMQYVTAYFQYHSESTATISMAATMNGKTVPASDIQLLENSYVSPGGYYQCKFLAKEAGTYTVQFTAKNAGGSINSPVYTVKATQKPPTEIVIQLPDDPTPEPAEPERYAIHLNYYQDGVFKTSTLLQVKPGESIDYFSSFDYPGTPARVEMDQGSWTGGQLLSFKNVHADGKVDLFYETEPEPEPEPEPTEPERYTIRLNYYQDGVFKTSTLLQFEPGESMDYFTPYDYPGTAARVEMDQGSWAGGHFLSFKNVHADGKVDLFYETEPEPTPTPTPEPETRQDGSLSNFRTRSSYRSGMFQDIPWNAWFVDNVSRAYSLGLMNGIADNYFSPESNLTVIQAITLAARLHNIYYSGSEDFSAYSGSNWYDCYLNYAKANGLVNDRYDYFANADRETFVCILAAALPDEALPDIVGHNVKFADSSLIVYHSDIGRLARAGIITGTPGANGLYFNPRSFITRAEVAAIVTRMADPNLRVH